MALAETARLLASIELQDKFSGTIKTIEGKLDSVGQKLDGVGTAAGRGVDRARTKFGQLKDSLRDSNTQIGIVGTALAGLENFVPPDLRPFVRGLEDINNAAPRGIPGLVGTALAGLKTITANTVTVVGKAVTSPGGAGGDGTGSRLVALGIAGAILAVATEVIGPPLRQFFIDNGLAGSGSSTGKSQSQIAFEAMHGTLKEIERNTNENSLEARDALFAQNRTNDHLEELRAATLASKSNITVNVPVTIRNQSLGGITTTTYSRYSTSVSGTGGSQI